VSLHLLRGSERTAARPGPGALPEALLRALEVTVARRVEGLLAGDYRSKLLGRGGELAQIRPYEPETDDVRQIDWKATARTGVPHVRVQLAERVLVTWIVLDLSPSMDFGTAERRKVDVAEGVALALGYAATRRGNRVGAVVFGDDGTASRAPRAGQAGMIGLLLGLRGESPKVDGPGTLADAIRRTAKLARQQSLVVIASDFRGPRDWRRPLLELAGRHEVITVEIRDPREQELPNVGELRLVDPETNRQLRVDTSSAALRRRFAAAAAEERRELAAMLAGAGVRHVVLDTEGDWLRGLTGFLRTRPVRR
jgi:uncharacterized protein (DUF58 family)